MKHLVTVREFARLTTEEVTEPSLDRAQISVSAFNWLCGSRARLASNGSDLLHFDDRRSLRLDNYVGVLETPCGTLIEILPKVHDRPGTETTSRRLLRRMIAAALDMKPREAGTGDLESFNAPLSEWVIAQFLVELRHVVNRGLRFDYRNVEENSGFLRGRLDVSRQMRQPLGRQHRFEIRHDLFGADRAENRLLRRALDQAVTATQSPENWRLAQELRFFLQEVPQSTNVNADLQAWRDDRLMAHYRGVRPWCELILYRRMPYSLLGGWHGISMLLPMERLFERYVTSYLQRFTDARVTFRRQAASEFLCIHEGERMFRLEPDVLLETADRRWVLDMKWKQLDESDRANRYGISQADLYQLFAYGVKYLGSDGGELVLIYPKSASFAHPLPVFDLGKGLRLHALPFDMDQQELVGFDNAELPLSTT